MFEVEEGIKGVKFHCLGCKQTIEIQYRTPSYVVSGDLESEFEKAKFRRLAKKIPAKDVEYHGLCSKCHVIYLNNPAWISIPGYNAKLLDLLGEVSVN